MDLWDFSGHWTICTLQVDLIYLFCEKEEMEKYFIICRDSKLYPKSRKTTVIEAIHFMYARTLQDNSEYTRDKAEHMGVVDSCRAVFSLGFFLLLI